MKKVIERYKKLIFVFTVINCFALLVNLANVNMNSDGPTHYLTTKNDGKNEFWPFVTFSYDYTTQNSQPVTTTYFNGIFYNYDWGEFFLYMGLLVSFLMYKAYIADPPKAKIQSA